MHCGIEAMNRYLQRYGWLFRYRGDSVWHTGWTSPNSRFFKLKIRLDRTVVRFEVKLVDPIENFDDDKGLRILNYLMSLNHEANLIKLSLHQKCIFIKLEVLNKDFRFKQLELALGVLDYYCDSIYKEVLKMLAQTKNTEVCS